MPRTDEPVTTAKTVPTNLPANLEGAEWVLRSLNGHGLVTGTSITAEFTRDGIGGYSGCNSYGSSARMDDGALDIARPMSTAVGCPGSRGRQEKAYLDALPKANDYRMRDDRLEIQDVAGKTILVYERKPPWRSNPADLVGTRWELRSINGKSTPEGFTPTLSFDSESRHTGYDGCRHFTGTYGASADDIVFTSQSMKELDCMKPGALQEAGAGFAGEAVGAGGDYRLSEGRLEIRTDAGDTFIFVPLRGEIGTGQSGPPWTLEKFAEGESASSVLEGTEITLSFDRGTLRESGSAGCNTYTADYTYHRDSLTFEALAVTKMACEDPAGVMEQRYLSFLEDVNGYYQKIDGRLHLTVPDGRELVFTGPE